jgi:hypothetical protein
MRYQRVVGSLAAYEEVFGDTAINNSKAVLIGLINGQ